MKVVRFRSLLLCPCCTCDVFETHLTPSLVDLLTQTFEEPRGSIVTQLPLPDTLDGPVETCRRVRAPIPLCPLAKWTVAR